MFEPNNQSKLLSKMNWKNLADYTKSYMNSSRANTKKKNKVI